MEFRLKALTPVWTGGVEGKNDKLHVTGIKGSIRWWYEVLIRGLGYYACDPTANGHCELKPKELNRDKPLSKQVKEQVCPACNMFGCTGWSGKFILKLMEPDTNKLIQSLSSRGAAFNLHFLEQKKIDPEEELLLEMILKLIVDYGAVGGKTTFKPSEMKYKNTKLHHRDFGLIERGDNSNLRTERLFREDIHKYLEPFKENAKANNKENDVEWPDLNYFWFDNEKYLNRVELNSIVRRNARTPKYYLASADPAFHKWLGGDIAVSKKIFSFHSAERCWGYTKKDDGMFYSLMEELIACNITNIKCGAEVMDEL